ncbi:WD40-repeat-containing domain protein [Clohesyomyces aquaticus]|uniref:WD40-repeat-containing domain protein n=1 Tax=Clohesyomyces aquaticus TaxID=1231657 RepID=A0A1Y1ZPB6_9PLEO|nr:WD40-repeat-containing domain protein [Clohesyomyces aquaticus]
MAKRKRDAQAATSTATPKQASLEKLPTKDTRDAAANGHAEAAQEREKEISLKSLDISSGTTIIQIITGSYERILHGFTAAVPQALVTGHGIHSSVPKETENASDPQVSFSDTFLFNAHSSAIRCLALSPPTLESSKITLASGSTDERINVYSLSTTPPPNSKTSHPIATLHGPSISQNPRNKELGSLLHHSSSITALYFPTRSKLLSAAEDSTIAITRTRDWTPLSTIKAPIPKPQGRPSGDTAAPGEVPAGINDFAVHPSMKLMVSVGRGEKCMRLWNLVTGKKAGVLNFGKDVLIAGGESRFGNGEGRKVVWDSDGEEFVVGFERGAVVFDVEDSRPKVKVVTSPRTKVHQLRYLPGERNKSTLAVSTEDGRVLFYDTASTTSATTESAKEEDIPSCTLIAQLGGPAAGITGRVKDFEILSPSPEDESSGFILITGSSDGAVRMWSLSAAELQSATDASKPQSGFTANQVGRLLGTYATGNRITCLKAFVMTGKADEVEDEEEEKEIVTSEGSSSGESDVE